MKLDTLNKSFQKIIIGVLLFLMSVVIIVSTFELGVTIVNDLLDISQTENLFFDTEELLKIFGFFFMILIGLELFETIRIYLNSNIIHVEVIFIVAMTAISRKVIIIDYKNQDPLTIIGIAAIIICLTTGYYLIKKIHIKERAKSGKEKSAFF